MIISGSLDAIPILFFFFYFPNRQAPFHLCRMILAWEARARFTWAHGEFGHECYGFMHLEFY